VSAGKYELAYVTPFRRPLGAFAGMRNANISFNVYVCLLTRPPVCAPTPGTARLLLHGFLWNFVRGYFSVFKKYEEKIQVSSKSDKNNGYFTWRRNAYLIISCSVLIKIRNISGKSLEKIKTHILCSITFFFLKSFLLWDNLEQIL
jgi:hypothetical protein